MLLAKKNNKAMQACVTKNFGLKPDVSAVTDNATFSMTGTFTRSLHSDVVQGSGTPVVLINCLEVSIMAGVLLGTSVFVGGSPFLISSNMITFPHIFSMCCNYSLTNIFHFYTQI